MDVDSVVGAQRRRRRLRFWLGFAVIALVGGLWAGLSKDPIGPGLFNDGFNGGFAEAPAIEFGREFEDFEVVETTVAEPPPIDESTTAPAPPSDEATTTVTGPTTIAPTTAQP